METTMEQVRVPEPVDFGGAVIRQLALLWVSRRPLFLLVGALGVLALAGEPLRAGNVTRLVGLWPVWVVLIGPIWALAVFNDEGPSHRHYHWAQPVARHSHTLARLAAGALYLWGVYLMVVAAAFVFAYMDGHLWQLRELGMAAWLNFFTGPLIGYLAVSVLTVASDYPLRWLLGLIFLVPLVMGPLAHWLGFLEVLERLTTPITHPEWGLAVTLVGAFLADAMRVVELSMGVGVSGVAAAPAVWHAATGLWILVFVGLVVFVATRHPDRLPRLRRSR
jgi:hypothetical protein